MSLIGSPRERAVPSIWRDSSCGSGLMAVAEICPGYRSWMNPHDRLGASLGGHAGRRRYRHDHGHRLWRHIPECESPEDQYPDDEEGVPAIYVDRLPYGHSKVLERHEDQEEPEDVDQE